MELMYPIAIIICAILSIGVFCIRFKNKVKYTNGKKVANTKYIKEKEYYKRKVRKYKILSTIIKVLTIICIMITSILIARTITIQNKSEDVYNRDILISLDMSTSQVEVNLELVKKFKAIIPSIEGDRIGIIIYNTAPIVYCPLTDDYEYINSCLDDIEKELQKVIDDDGKIPITTEDGGYDSFTFWYGGIIANNQEKGSSLVGDGLAGTIFSFPNIKEDKERTRIIIFATDNDVAGTETITLEEACKLCKEYNINLYAYCPTTEMNPYTSQDKINSYKKAVEKNADGKFYTGDLDKLSSQIVDEIKETKTSLIKTSNKTFVTDHPEILVISITIVFLILIIIEKRVKLW